MSIKNGKLNEFSQEVTSFPKSTWFVYETPDPDGISDVY
jgi:hypothetical protein